MIGAKLLSGLSAVLAASAAMASQPVPRTIDGCIGDGAFTSRDGYEITVVARGGAPFDLRRYEGRRLRIRGDLLPGDNLILTAPPRDLGPCAPAVPPAR